MLISISIDARDSLPWPELNLNAATSSPPCTTLSYSPFFVLKFKMSRGKIGSTVVTTATVLRKIRGKLVKAPRQPYQMRATT